MATASRFQQARFGSSRYLNPEGEEISPLIEGRVTRNLVARNVRARFLTSGMLVSMGETTLSASGELAEYSVLGFPEPFTAQSDQATVAQRLILSERAMTASGSSTASAVLRVRSDSSLEASGSIAMATSALFQSVETLSANALTAASCVRVRLAPASASAAAAVTVSATVDPQIQPIFGSSSITATATRTRNVSGSLASTAAQAAAGLQGTIPPPLSGAASLVANAAKTFRVSAQLDATATATSGGYTYQLLPQYSATGTLDAPVVQRRRNAAATMSASAETVIRGGIPRLASTTLSAAAQATVLSYDISVVGTVRFVARPVLVDATPRMDRYKKLNSATRVNLARNPQFDARQRTPARYMDEANKQFWRRHDAEAMGVEDGRSVIKINYVTVSDLEAVRRSRGNDGTGLQLAFWNNFNTQSWWGPTSYTSSYARPENGNTAFAISYYVKATSSALSALTFSVAGHSNSFPLGTQEQVLVPATIIETLPNNWYRMGAVVTLSAASTYSALSFGPKITRAASTSTTTHTVTVTGLLVEEGNNHRPYFDLYTRLNKLDTPQSLGAKLVEKDSGSQSALYAGATYYDTAHVEEYELGRNLLPAVESYEFQVTNGTAELQQQHAFFDWQFIEYLVSSGPFGKLLATKQGAPFALKVNASTGLTATVSAATKWAVPISPLNPADDFFCFSFYAMASAFDATKTVRAGVRYVDGTYAAVQTLYGSNVTLNATWQRFHFAFPSNPNNAAVKYAIPFIESAQTGSVYIDAIQLEPNRQTPTSVMNGHFTDAYTWTDDRFGRVQRYGTLAGKPPPTIVDGTTALAAVSSVVNLGRKETLLAATLDAVAALLIQAKVPVTSTARLSAASDSATTAIRATIHPAEFQPITATTSSNSLSLKAQDRQGFLYQFSAGSYSTLSSLTETTVPYGGIVPQVYHPFQIEGAAFLDRFVGAPDNQTLQGRIPVRGQYWEIPPASIPNGTFYALNGRMQPRLASDSLNAPVIALARASTGQYQSVSTTLHDDGSVVLVEQRIGLISRWLNAQTHYLAELTYGRDYQDQYVLKIKRVSNGTPFVLAFSVIDAEPQIDMRFETRYGLQRLWINGTALIEAYDTTLLASGLSGIFASGVLPRFTVSGFSSVIGEQPVLDSLQMMDGVADAIASSSVLFRASASLVAQPSELAANANRERLAATVMSVAGGMMVSANVEFCATTVQLNGASAVSLMAVRDHRTFTMYWWGFSDFRPYGYALNVEDIVVAGFVPTTSTGTMSVSGIMRYASDLGLSSEGVQASDVGARWRTLPVNPITATSNAAIIVVRQVDGAAQLSANADALVQNTQLRASSAAALAANVEMSVIPVGNTGIVFRATSARMAATTSDNLIPNPSLESTSTSPNSPVPYWSAGIQNNASRFTLTKLTGTVLHSAAKAGSTSLRLVFLDNGQAGTLLPADSVGYIRTYVPISKSDTSFQLSYYVRHTQFYLKPFVQVAFYDSKNVLLAFYEDVFTNPTLNVWQKRELKVGSVGSAQEFPLIPSGAVMAQINIGGVTTESRFLNTTTNPAPSVYFDDLSLTYSLESVVDDTGIIASLEVRESASLVATAVVESASRANYGAAVPLFVMSEAGIDSGLTMTQQASVDADAFIEALALMIERSGSGLLDAASSITSSPSLLAASGANFDALSMALLPFIRDRLTDASFDGLSSLVPFYLRDRIAAKELEAASDSAIFGLRDRIHQIGLSSEGAATADSSLLANATSLLDAVADLLLEGGAFGVAGRALLDAAFLLSSSSGVSYGVSAEVDASLDYTIFGLRERNVNSAFDAVGMLATEVGRIRGISGSLDSELAMSALGIRDRTSGSLFDAASLIDGTPSLARLSGSSLSAEAVMEPVPLADVLIGIIAMAAMAAAMTQTSVDYNGRSELSNDSLQQATGGLQRSSESLLTGDSGIIAAALREKLGNGAFDAYSAMPPIGHQWIAGGSALLASAAALQTQIYALLIGRSIMAGSTDHATTASVDRASAAALIAASALIASGGLPRQVSVEFDGNSLILPSSVRERLVGSTLDSETAQDVMLQRMVGGSSPLFGTASFAAAGARQRDSGATIAAASDLSGYGAFIRQAAAILDAVGLLDALPYLIDFIDGNLVILRQREAQAAMRRVPVQSVLFAPEETSNPILRRDRREVVLVAPEETANPILRKRRPDGGF